MKKIIIISLTLIFSFVGMAQEKNIFKNYIGFTPPTLNYLIVENRHYCIYANDFYDDDTNEYQYLYCNCKYTDADFYICYLYYRKAKSDYIDRYIIKCDFVDKDKLLNLMKKEENLRYVRPHSWVYTAQDGYNYTVIGRQIGDVYHIHIQRFE